MMGQQAMLCPWVPTQGLEGSGLLAVVSASLVIAESPFRSVEDSLRINVVSYLYESPCYQGCPSILATDVAMKSG